MRALPNTTRTATCETCGSVHDVSVPTPGFRCEACIVTDSDADARRTRNRALALFAGGAILISIAALLWIAGFDEHPETTFRRTPIPLYVGFAGVGMFGVGAGMLRYRPRLKLPD